jgi:N-acetyl-anhydromuramyl-L-alanine amidase AmpD
METIKIDGVDYVIPTAVFDLLHTLDMANTNMTGKLAEIESYCQTVQTMKNNLRGHGYSLEECMAFDTMADNILETINE